ncbi:hypothetical protein [Nocardia gipuzkoensis]
MRITIDTDESMTTPATAHTGISAVGPAEADDAGASTADTMTTAAVTPSADDHANDAGAPPQWLVDAIERARAHEDTESDDAGAMRN